MGTHGIGRAEHGLFWTTGSRLVYGPSTFSTNDPKPIRKLEERERMRPAARNKLIIIIVIYNKKSNNNTNNKNNEKKYNNNITTI